MISTKVNGPHTMLGVLQDVTMTISFTSLPSGTHGFGKRSCAKKRWEHAGDCSLSFTPDGEWSELEHALRSYLDEDGTKEHIHLAINIDEIYAPPGNSYGEH